MTLGYLYASDKNAAPSGQAFEGLTGTESNQDASGQPVSVFQIQPSTPNAYYMPGADPGEGYMATNNELFGTILPGTTANDIMGCWSRRFPAGQHDDADALARTGTNEAYATYIRRHSVT